jgi:dihydrofolate synthase/folylpolyglutamate synthase
MKTKKDINTIKFIHVAGTNGKGSTCSFIAHGLIQAGYRTGKFTSPHVLDITERITVNDVPIALERIPQLPSERWFQTLWETALEHFVSEQVDYAVIETGIGGLYDCTNSIEPVISVITKIGYDHMDLLGNTIEEIARHKAGIIKAGVPVVTDPSQYSEAMLVIGQTAESMNSPLIIPAQRTDKPFGYNKIIAGEVLRALGIERFDFSQVKLLARMQPVGQNPLIIVDGAHNLDSIRAALDVIAEYSCKKVIVFGMINSKDYESCNKLLSGFLVVRTDGFSPDAVQCGGVSTAEAIAKAKELAGSEGLILVCGSLYLAGEVLKMS